MIGLRYVSEMFFEFSGSQIDGDTAERLLGVELGYVEWCIGVDGVFENGEWKNCG